jgi:hypothetical protein
VIKRRHNICWRALRTAETTLKHSALKVLHTAADVSWPGSSGGEAGSAKRRAIDLLDPASLLRAVRLQVTPVALRADRLRVTYEVSHSPGVSFFRTCVECYMPAAIDPIPSVMTLSH